MNRVELLAPAGNMEALKGAIAAGADAVYLGGSAFGARAYADNFTEEELIAGIRYAHLFDCKIYLTVNTLVKEKELDQLYPFLQPLYEAGLDGVIIQDLGVFSFIREYFPGLELHVSTQMTITGAYGAEFLEKQGACRVVPARELSLAEIREIKGKTGLEIEAFVHGAMCYCYSGQCLFSSILGGRSGNRGRCAQPCRLPYQVQGTKEQYPLSMKDMCTVFILPELIDAGIDSFKIEGRMKKPEYAAGVTAIYRKYINRYYALKGKNALSEYQVDPEDYEKLKQLYIRSGISEGYYHKHNGKDMITLSSPAYSGTNEDLLLEIRRTFLEQESQIPVALTGEFLEGKRSHLFFEADGICTEVYGEIVDAARKQPLTKEKIEEQLQKSGGTIFKITKLSLQTDENIFLPVSKLNELRREGLKILEEKLYKEKNLGMSARKAKPFSGYSSVKNKIDKQGDRSNHTTLGLHVLVHTWDQLHAALKSGCGRIYLEMDEILFQDDLYAQLLTDKRNTGREYILVSPYVVRYRDNSYLNQVLSALKRELFDGVLLRSLEMLSYLQENAYGGKLIADSNLYVWNRKAYELLKPFVNEMFTPAELNMHELRLLKEHADIPDSEQNIVVYGRLPMMISAGCVQKTTEGCVHKSGYIKMKDRYGKEFPIYHDCQHCYNVIYNSVPLSLHHISEALTAYGSCRLDFTTENKEKTKAVLDFYEHILRGDKPEPPYREFTTGHFKRGVE